MPIKTISSHLISSRLVSSRLWFRVGIFMVTVKGKHAEPSHDWVNTTTQRGLKSVRWEAMRWHAEKGRIMKHPHTSHYLKVTVDGDGQLSHRTRHDRIRSGQNAQSVREQHTAPRQHPLLIHSESMQPYTVQSISRNYSWSKEPNTCIQNCVSCSIQCENIRMTEHSRCNTWLGFLLNQRKFLSESKQNKNFGCTCDMQLFKR